MQPGTPLSYSHTGAGLSTAPRGRGAKGKCPFVVAVSMNEKGHPMFMRFSVVKGFKTGELTRWLKSPKS